MNREETLVELVDGAGRPSGAATVAQAHTAPGRLHRAFSVLLVDDEGQLLLQQRSRAKTRFPLRWANACCGHPSPGEPVSVAANRRLGEEIGLPDVVLTEIGVHLYRAADPQTGRVEHEYDHVVLGRISHSTPLRPDPAEVAALHWIYPGELFAAIEADADSYAPWLPGVTHLLSDRAG